MSYQDLKNCRMITAFITPFHEDGSINFEAIPPLIEHLLAHHTDGILLAGTTAESPTLTHDEELELLQRSKKVVNGRVPLIAGVGTNETRDSIEFVKEGPIWWFCCRISDCPLLQQTFSRRYVPAF